MKQMAFAVVLLISAASLNAQEFSSSVTMDGGPVSHTVKSDGSTNTCFKLADQGVCISRDRNGRVSGGSASTAYPVAPGASMIVNGSADRDGNATVCVGVKAGTPGSRGVQAQAQQCMKINSNGQVSTYGEVGAGIGPVHTTYRTKEYPIH